jgi:hypothetical protein
MSADTRNFSEAPDVRWKPSVATKRWGQRVVGRDAGTSHDRGGEPGPRRLHVFVDRLGNAGIARAAGENPVDHA